MNTDRPLLEVNDLHAWYGESHVLHGIGFQANKGEIVTLLGRNGAGKSTTLRSIIGLQKQRQGQVLVNGSETVHMQARSVARMGVGYCPETRGILAGLSVTENLVLPPRWNAGGFSLEQLYEWFPNLWERRHSQGTKLSGGEQQMLAIARILRTGASIILLDEPTEGLAPVIVKQIGKVISGLRENGYTVVLVEQNLHFAGALADRHFVVEQGRVVDQVAGADFHQELDKLNGYLAV
nr:ABC transporter ATP-binding protein [Marinobacter sp. F3R11]